MCRRMWSSSILSVLKSRPAIRKGSQKKMRIVHGSVDRCSWLHPGSLHPSSLTWNLTMMGSKMNLLFQHQMEPNFSGSMFSFGQCNNWPLKSDRSPIWKDRLPFPPFFKGKMLNFRGVLFWSQSFSSRGFFGIGFIPIRTPNKKSQLFLFLFRRHIPKPKVIFLGEFHPKKIFEERDAVPS